ncbi:response regulator [Leisingera sp.]|uniref:response regulator n=1 Tax=Leisingera sp. TaxID=1879318 RepID=UPI003A917770
MSEAMVAAPGGGAEPDPWALLGGRAYCEALVEQLSRQFRADFVAIGDRRIGAVDRVRCLASRFDGLPVDDLDMECEATAAGEVLRQGRVQVTAGGVRARFPRDEICAEEGIQSYVGVALCRADGEAMGLIQAAWRRAVPADLCQQVAALMDAHRPRLAAEVAAMQVEAALAALAVGCDGAGTAETFGWLAEQLQRAFNARAAFIAERREEATDSYRVLACCAGGLQLPVAADAVVSFVGAPCASLRDQPEAHAARDVLEAGDWQVSFAAGGAEEICALQSYLGFAIRDAEGQMIGHFALLHDRKLERAGLDNRLIEVFLARIGRDLRRRRDDWRRNEDERAAPVAPEARSFDQLAGTVAHEFNNVLAAMQGRTELALASLGGGHPAERHVEVVAEGVQAATGLVRQLLCAGREGGDAPPEIATEIAPGTAPDPAAPDAAPPPSMADRRRILVVDDEETVRRAVAGLLKLRGCDVSLADGCDAALALQGSGGPFDGAVIDMNMPGRGGWETLSQLRAAQPGLSAVMMSGFAISAADAGFPALADVQVLDKPFTKEHLYQAVLG